METKKTVYITVIFLFILWLCVMIDIRQPTNSTHVIEGSEQDEQSMAQAKKSYETSKDYKETTSDNTFNLGIDSKERLNNDTANLEPTEEKIERMSLQDDSSSDMVGSFSMEEPLAGVASSGFSLEPMNVEKIINEIVEENKYNNIGISIAESYVNIRKKPNAESESLGKLHRNAAAKILDTKDGWYLVESGDVKGYVNSSYIRTDIPYKELLKKYGSPTISITVDGLNVREKADVDSKKITVIYKNDKCMVTDILEEWVEIKLPNSNSTGYIKKEYTDMVANFKKAISKEEEQEIIRKQEEQKQKALEAENKVKKETQVQQGSASSYTEKELKLLACLVNAEARGQIYEGKLAVANVVLNRVKSSRYPNSIEGVIYQSGQFSVARNGVLQKELDRYSNYTSSGQKASIKAAKAALNGSNNIGNRLYFNSYKAAVNSGHHNKPSALKIQDQLFW